MKKKITMILFSGIMALALAACGAEESSQNDRDMVNNTTRETVDAKTENVTDQNNGGTDVAETSGNHILIAYFSMPEDIDTDGIDANTGASVVIRDGEVLGNVQFLAQTIQETIGGDLFRIETTRQYPLEHDSLIEQAAEEQEENARPELVSHIDNVEQYDTILLGYPNWWGDMPQALYTFLEEHDFAGKTIIPFCPHGGSGFSRTESTIAELQPEARVSGDGLSISRNNVADSAKEVADWAEGLGL